METLKIPQARLLSVLAQGGVASRQRLAERCGFSVVSGTVTRILNGLREGSSSGAAHAGLIALGFVEQLELRMDGVSEMDGASETVYRITRRGRIELALWLERNELPPMRDAKASTNKRYQGGRDAVDQEGRSAAF